MKRSIRDLDLKGKRVLIRADFNVPLDDKGSITDDNRINASLPTIKLALDRGAKVILMSHLGRPKGKRVEKMSLGPVAERLSQILGRRVRLCSDCVGAQVSSEIVKVKNGALVLLENLRFHSEEEKNDASFAKGLASFGDVYVNDAFGTSHRAHASVAAITHLLPSAAGLLLEKEIKFLGETLKDPAKPFVAILGGAKVSDKIGVLDNLIHKVDKIIVGGAMAYTFLKVKKYPVGKSRVEDDKLAFAEGILKKASIEKIDFLLPSDNLAVQDVREDAPYQVVEGGIPDGWEGVDIGPKTIKEFTAALRDAKTVIWNGPMGIFEMPNFRNGSYSIAKALADNHTATTIIGGGDTAACVIQAGLGDRMSHISTGGGASLEYMEGKSLPGIESLPNKN
jgi:3-phosphoglycerate kinase